MKTNTASMKKIFAFVLIAGTLVSVLPFGTKQAAAVGVNLIKNPSVETGGVFPDFWSKVKGGTNTTTFRYPSSGVDSLRGVRIDMSSYLTGDAKWYFANVPVTPSVKYVFSDSYISNVPTRVDVQYMLTTGATRIVSLGTVPASLVKATKQFTFTAPVGVVSATVFHSINRNGYLITDSYFLGENISDVVAPVVSITSPVSGAVVSGTITVSATATDNIGVSGVQFVLDGKNFGNSVLSAPYTIAVNTAVLSVGTHTISAIASDTSKNSTTSASVSFVVPDTNSPRVVITGPLSNNSVSGETSVSVQASDNVAVAGVTLLVDGVALPIEDTTAPYTFLWDTRTETNATHSLTARARDTSGNTMVSIPVSVIVKNTNSDTTAPVVSVFSPVAGTAVSDAVAVSVKATDNVGVVGVSLFVDGSIVGTEVTNVPYDFSWDTKSVSNGVHTISATARDARGNIGTSNGVAVTVNNIVIAPNLNLILNPSLETIGTNGDPENWFRGSWGTNTSVFTYPTVGIDGGKAGKVEVTNYTDGDAKWYFGGISAVGGQVYSFSESYKSNVPTQLFVQYQIPTGIQFQSLAISSATLDAWKTEMHTIIVPASATGFTIFRAIATNGTLEIDNYSLTLGNTSPTADEMFLRGLVSFTFDDGWITQYQVALPVLNTAGLKGSFYFISKESLNSVPTERISNPSLETIGTNGDPENWFRGNWGTNTAVFTYPVVGVDGGKAGKVEVTNYTDGDAKWYFADTAVTPGSTYILSDSYQANTASSITLRYTLIDGSVQYVDIATLASTGDLWQNFTKTIVIPANVASVTAFHLLSGNGTLTVDRYSLNITVTYANLPQMLEFQSSGHEVGGHTQTHVALSLVPEVTANGEILGSRNDLLGAGITNPDTMAYPFGEYNTSVETMAKNAGFIAARSTDKGFNTKSTDKYALKIQQMDRTTTLADVQAWVAQAVENKTWLILMFHQEDENVDADLGVSPEFFQQVVNYVKTANVDVVTVKQGVAQMN